MNKLYGIIDIGSNTMRLVIYGREKSGRLNELENVKSLARLRNYLHPDGYLTETGVHKLITTLLSFRKITEFHQLSSIKCVATATIRQALNKEEIIRLVNKETGFTMRVLSEFEEAFYGYLAVVNTTSFMEGMTIDIGGGSTEITYFKDRALAQYHSFPFGALSLSQQFISNELPSSVEIAKMKEFIKSNFQSLSWLENKRIPLIGMGGSARNMVQVDQVLKNYPLAGLHLYEMPAEDIATIGNYVRSLPVEGLQKLEGISKDRAELMIPAIHVFEELVAISQAPSFVLSRKGLREGVLLEEWMQSLTVTEFPNVIAESFNKLAKDYDINLENVKKVTEILMQLVSELNRLKIISVNKKELEEMQRAAFVFHLGEYIDSENSSQHTFYLLANRTIDGLMHKERVKLALMASFKNKIIFKQYAFPFNSWFSEEEMRRLHLFGALLKFAYSLNRTKRNVVETLEIKVENNELSFFIVTKKNSAIEEYQAEKQKKHLEKLLGYTITIHFK
ncbi:Ppx/GppA family phosphatase [Sutcliffiella halmapala]|uniref:Ppx/GppA family phosphatase n=1 Tax=Sutcliffiella halmapala TaxID=79882 RepID=UPI0009949821|nr:Ppx/GppA family phosphatase [Sutcliffiella halmapala]